jgi:hypothetical protein
MQYGGWGRCSTPDGFVDGFTYTVGSYSIRKLFSTPIDGGFTYWIQFGTPSAGSRASFSIAPSTDDFSCRPQRPHCTSAATLRFCTLNRRLFTSIGAPSHGRLYMFAFLSRRLSMHPQAGSFTQVQCPRADGGCLRAGGGFVFERLRCRLRWETSGCAAGTPNTVRSVCVGVCGSRR